MMEEAPASADTAEGDLPVVDSVAVEGDLPALEPMDAPAPDADVPPPAEAGEDEVTGNNE
jgi:hypothetical protein